jgi:hypothetical protein
VALKHNHWLEIRKALEHRKTGLDPAVSLSDGLEFFKNCWNVPEGRDLHQEILSQNHDSRIARHFGQLKIADKINANFYRPNMDQDIEEYLRSCNSCHRNKTARHKKYSALQPLEVPYRPWTSSSKDVIVGLSESSEYTKIWVTVHHVSKMSHFIPLTSVNKTEDIAMLFLTQVWKNHGLPDDIVSDRDLKFISYFWQSLLDLPSVRLNLSTAFHPKTDGETTRVNQTLKDYMHNYCSY